MTAPETSRTEVIAFCSGKGGTGKTSLISALGFALRSSGHRVLMIDADRATDGFSLYILGPEGMSQVGAFAPRATFVGLLDEFAGSEVMAPEPHTIHRLGSNDHGLSYDAIISGKGLYGDDSQLPSQHGGIDWNRQFERPLFQRAVVALFDALRRQARYDYVLIDTRGGFSYESTDVAAAADSFVLVTEATHTNFYQDRNLIDRINAAALQLGTRSLLRGIIVNKSTEPPETSFRNELVREFGLRFEDTFAVQLDVEAAHAYKVQKAVYLAAPASKFSFDSLRAFQQLLRVVTAQWPTERVEEWNRLVRQIDAAIAAHNEDVAKLRRAEEERGARLKDLEVEAQRLAIELKGQRAAAEQERSRQEILVTELREQAARHEGQLSRALSDRETLYARQSELSEGRTRLAETEWARYRRQSTVATFFAFTTLVLLLVVALMFWNSRRDAAVSSVAQLTPAPVYAPSAPVSTAAASAASAAAVTSLVASAEAQVPNDASQVVGRPLLPLQERDSTLKYCRAGSYNVIVASYRDFDRAQASLREFQGRYPQFEFAVVESNSARNDNPLRAIFSGLGLTNSEAAALARRLREAGITDAYVTRQSVDCGGSSFKEAEQKG